MSIARATLAGVVAAITIACGAPARPEIRTAGRPAGAHGNGRSGGEARSAGEGGETRGAAGKTAKGPPLEAAPTGPLLGEYEVGYDGKGVLRVEATLHRAGQLLAVESGAERFVSDFEVSALDGSGSARWTKAGRSNRSFVVPACAAGSCRVRYRYALREAARALDDLDIASEEREVIEAPPSTWIAAPASAPGTSRIRFHVTTPAGTTFVTGVFRSSDRAPNAQEWTIALGDLWTAPYSAFGPLRVRALEIPQPPAPDGAVRAPARIDLALAPGKLTLTDEELVTWTTDAARAIVGYFGRFPMPEALVLLVPARGRWVGEGKTLSGGGGAIFMRIGERATSRALQEDWVLVHEMTHLAFPSVAREHDWAEEGLATYVEPFARARVGIMTVEEAWRGLVDGLPNGLPAAGDQGLDRTPTWGRTYWGGCLYYLLADIEIRKRTGGRFGLEHALRGILAVGGSNAQRWDLEDALTTADKAIGTTVLRDLHSAMGRSPHPVDLDALWQQLGVIREGKLVRFDDAAPLAHIRKAMTAVAP